MGRWKDRLAQGDLATPVSHIAQSFRKGFAEGSPSGRLSPKRECHSTVSQRALTPLHPSTYREGCPPGMIFSHAPCG